MAEVAVDQLNQLINIVTRLEEQRFACDLAELSRKIPKRPLVLFFGYQQFADNSKYLYLRATMSARGYDVLWCTLQPEVARSLEKAGLPHLLITADIDHAYATMLQAAVAVFSYDPLECLGSSEQLLATLAGASTLQLWHGIGVKRLQLQLFGHREVSLTAGSWANWTATARADYVLSTSAHWDAHWTSAFGARQLVRAGMPRNEVMLRPATSEEHIAAELPAPQEAALRSADPAVLIIPTWQRGGVRQWIGKEQILAAAAYGRRNGVDMFVKIHPRDPLGAELASLQMDRLHVMDANVDVYPWLAQFSAMVTDYSSIMFDYLLTGRPVLAVDIPPQSRAGFEPDYSLVPDGPYQMSFVPQTFARTLDRALSSDAGREERLAYSKLMFETDPLSASDDLLLLVDELVARSQQGPVQVWRPGAVT